MDERPVDTMGLAASTAMSIARARRAGRQMANADPIPSREVAEDILADAVIAYASPIEGFGLAATSSVCARLLRCESPLAAPLFSDDRIVSGGKLEVAPSLLGIGVELVFRIGRSLSPDEIARSQGTDQIADLIVSCAVGFQVLGRRLPIGSGRDTWTALADFGLAAKHVRGAELRRWRDLDLRAQTLHLAMDGHEVMRGRGQDVLGHPLAAVWWLLDQLRRRGAGIEAGAFVSVGSCTGLAQLVPGHTYVGRCAESDVIVHAE